MNLDTLSHTLWAMRDSDRADEADFRAALEAGIAELDREPAVIEDHPELLAWSGAREEPK